MCYPESSGLLKISLFISHFFIQSAIFTMYLPLAQTLCYTGKCHCLCSSSASDTGYWIFTQEFVKPLAIFLLLFVLFSGVAFCCCFVFGFCWGRCCSVAQAGFGLWEPSCPSLSNTGSTAGCFCGARGRAWGCSCTRSFHFELLPQWETGSLNGLGVGSWVEGMVSHRQRETCKAQPRDI